MSDIEIKQLVIYPIKSCGALKVSEFILAEAGPLIQFGDLRIGDREWMVVSPEGLMFTQRKFPKMAILHPLINGKKLYLSVGEKVFEIPSQDSPQRITVEVWGSPVDVAHVGHIALDQALTSFLNTPAQLVHFDGLSQREALKKGQGIGVQTRLTDTSPYLLISEESLQDLNSRLNDRIGTDRFRANIVVSGPAAYGEDQWLTLKGQSAVLESSKACSRCVVITVDQETGISPNNETLKALAQYRKVGSQVFFGQYFISRTFAQTLKVGDRLKID